MRALVLALSLCAAPAAAADVTETLTPRYISVVQLEQMLLGRERLSGVFSPWGFPVQLPPKEAGPDQREGLASVLTRGLLPPGVAALSADSGRNTLTITGSVQAIQDVRNMVRLLDVPRRQVRITARVLKLEAAHVERLKAAQGASTLGLDERFLIVAGDAVADLLRLEPQNRFEQQVPSDGSLRLFLSGTRGEQRLASVHVRLNGDTTATLFVQSSIQRAEAGARTDAGAVRRLPVNGSMLVLDVPAGTGLLVTYEGPLPAADPQPRD